MTETALGTKGVFIAYAQRDHSIVMKLVNHLRVPKSLIYTHKIDQRSPDSNRLLQSRVVLLMISPDFLNSDYCYSSEMAQVVEWHKQGKVQVLPVIIRPIYWGGTPFASLQALPDGAQPITLQDSPSWALREVIQTIQTILENTLLVKEEVVVNLQPPISVQPDQVGARTKRPLRILIPSFLVILILFVTVFAIATRGVFPLFGGPNAVATAQVEANATAQALASTFPVAYPPTNLSPVLDDPLQDNSKGNRWEVDDQGKGNCKFINQTYVISTENVERCPAKATNFTNFIYEVQMKIIKGDGGGIAFRVDPTNPYQFYSFVINQNGSYLIADNSVLVEGSSSAIHGGLNQTNLIAAVVHGSIIELYVNHQRVAVAGSSTYTHGQIGVIVKGSEGKQTEVLFQNAKVWEL